jgi:AcrR family transcriptional regulator
MSQLSDRSRADLNLSPDDAKTRARLIDAAGRVFAEQGYDRALGKDIAVLANTNPAAINYHFGGKDRLYAAVLRDAHNRTVTVEQVRAVRAAGTSPAETLRALIGLAVRSMASDDGTGWPFRVIIRELAAPSAALEELFSAEMVPKLSEILQVIAAVAGLPREHPAVRRCMMSLAAQVTFPFHNRFIFGKLLPEMAADPKAIEALAEHVYEFSLAGIRAIARKAKAEKQG